ncbi:Carboxypeptidase M [Orchesella cincta]|uniref:Carboxypeptidase M n=1 Tax=Orchesella cincta TaxID=48709 RepID=A0A1D2MY68_ORCCI|nr:Carboxypeptidase M [Orchesella cincta]
MMEPYGFLIAVVSFLFIQLWGIAAPAQGHNVNVTCEYEAMTDLLHDLALNYSNIVRLESIGKTEEDREIWVMIVSDSPYNRPLLRPQVKFVGNVNGMSGPACYVLLRLTIHLLEQYESEASMERQLMESSEIHIIPNLNPDGYAKAVPGSCSGPEGRVNANNINLNTNFPDIFREKEGEIIQRETAAMIRYLQKNKFVISVSVISGAHVVVYPFDSVLAEEYFADGEPHLTPDDDIFKQLALTYAKKTGSPTEGWVCPRLNRKFPYGIINGAEWNPQSGTMMDYNYIHETFEIMAGISCCRNENDTAVLDKLWWNNREGLLHVVHEVETGIRGQVLDSETYEPIPEAKLEKKSYHYIEGDDEFSMQWYTTQDGEFWRPWQPGKHKLRVEKPGYKTAVVNVEVRYKQPTFLRVELEKVLVVMKSPTPIQNEKTEKPTTPQYDFPITATTSVTEYNSTTQHKDKPLEPEIRSLKHYSSLTQLDHSFLNLFRGIQQRNNAGSRNLKALPIVVPIQFVLHIVFLQNLL